MLPCFARNMISDAGDKTPNENNESVTLLVGVVHDQIRQCVLLVCCPSLSLVCAGIKFVLMALSILCASAVSA